VHLLGRRVTLGPIGLPAAIQSLFTPEMTSIGTTTADVLAAPASSSSNGPTARNLLAVLGPSFTRPPPDVKWRATASAGTWTWS